MSICSICFLLFPDSPVDAIRRAAITKGDSDSIACLTGAFARAYHGSAAWPDEWLERIEYRERLLSLMPLFSSQPIYAHTWMFQSTTKSVTLIFPHRPIV